MNWDALGAFGEIIGAFAVVVSLAYLATQIKTQNREARVASVHDISEAFRLGITSFQDAQRADVYINALSNFDLLSDSERLQFISMVQGLLRVWEEAFFQFAEDRLDNRVWDPMVAQYSDWMSSSGFQRVWEIRKHTYNPDFRKFVDELTFGDYKLS